MAVLGGVAESHQCPVCHVELSPHIAKACDTISGELFSVLRCVRCRAGVTVPAPARIDSYYETRYYGRRHSFTTRFCAWRRKLIVGASIRPGGRLLDVGCGEGEFMRAAASAGWDTAGVEVDGAPGPNTQKVYRSVEQAAREAPFRCITLWHVMEHMADPPENLRSLRSMLTSDGILLVAVPDFGGLQARLFGRHWLHLDVPRHLHHYTRPNLKRLLESAGFELVRTANQEVEYDWFGWIQSALNAVFPTPNVLFDALTGKPRRVGRLQVAACYALSALFAAPALALTVATSLAGWGGTLIVSAKPRP
jgi:hypothetical protein